MATKISRTKPTLRKNPPAEPTTDPPTATSMTGPLTRDTPSWKRVNRPPQEQGAVAPSAARPNVVSAGGPLVATVRVGEPLVQDYEEEENVLVIATLVTDSKAYMLPEVLEALKRLRWDGTKVLHVTSNGECRRSVRMVCDIWDGLLSLVNVDLYMSRDNQWHSGAVALLREETRRIIVEHHPAAQWVLWVDCDVVVPEDAAVTLREHGQGLVSGVVPSRAQSKIIARDKIGEVLLQPELVQSEGLRKIEMAGFGCLLMRRDVLEQMDWRPDELGMIVDGQGGEDDHACMEAAAGGAHVYLDPQVLCCHYAENRQGWAAVPGQSRTLNTFQMGVAPHSALKPRQNRGTAGRRALWLMASPACHGGVKVCRHMMRAMYDAGWEITVASLNPWEWGAWADWSFVRRTRPDMIAPPYDLVVANYYATLPIGAQIKAKKHLALIQSDEPEWHILDRHQAEAECFRTPGYQHVIIANHMRCFGEKYGMDIVGQIDNGVDALTFYPDWFLKREWPHSLMMIRKNAPVWFTGQEYAEQAVLELAKRYDDLEVVVVGQQAPRWPCKVRHVQTYDESELRRLLNNVSCFVRPSFIEGFSLTDLEAMACGTPLVVTPIGVSDVARHGEEALFAPNVPTDEFIARGRSAETRPALGQEIVAGIVAGVTRVFEEPELREKLAMGGLRLVRERTWEKQGEQWIDCVERVMAE